MSEYAYLQYRGITERELKDIIEPAHAAIERLGPQLYKTSAGIDPRTNEPYSYDVPLPRRIRVGVSSIEYSSDGSCKINLGGEDAKAECVALKTRIDAQLAAKFLKQAEPSLTASDCRTAVDVAAVEAGDVVEAEIPATEVVVAEAVAEQPVEEMPVDGAAEGK